MKKILLSIITLTIVQSSFAQWTNVSGTGHYYINSGNVSIGTTSTGFPLTVIGETYASGGFRVAGSLGDNVNAAPWYGIGASSVTLPDGLGGAVQLAGYWGLNFQSANGQMVMTKAGNVGIGTASPGSKLDVNGTARLGGGVDYGSTTVVSAAPGTIAFDAPGNPGGRFYISGSNGNIGIGTTTPEDKLHIQNGSAFIKTVRLGANSEFPLVYGTQAVNGVSGHAGMYLFEDGSGGFGQASGLSFKTSLNDASPVTNLVIRANGNVGIGTISPDAKLAVYGIIHSREVKVDLGVSGPDYVFEPAYKLPKLNELKDYLDKNHHLPEIPSADQMAKEGINLGDMNIKLLKKVEELTLYLIKKEEQLADQQKINQSLQNQIDQLAKKINN